MIDKNILIVEDNSLVALELKGEIESIGFNVSGIATRESEVFQCINNTEPHLILMDISLKGATDGIEVVKKIHKDKYIPIIYLTGNEDDKTINRAIETSPIGYLTKPFRIAEVKSNIKLALSTKNKKTYSLGFNYYLDIGNQHLYYKDQIQKLSKNETKLLNLLIIGKGELVTFNTIENEIWENQSITDDAIRLLVSRLRKKLNSEIIETVYSYGFKLSVKFKNY